jgi:predicted CopG family antitoxin
VTKTLTIKDEVYKKLAAVKDPDESFSDLFSRLVEGESSIEALKRLRGKVTFTDKERLLHEVSARREEKRL